MLSKREKRSDPLNGRRLACEHQVISKFAEQCDLILLLFDANKTDIGDEMQEAMAALKGNEDKVRVVLNKSDVSQIDKALLCFLEKRLESESSWLSMA